MGATRSSRWWATTARVRGPAVRPSATSTRATAARPCPASRPACPPGSVELIESRVRLALVLLERDAGRLFGEQVPDHALHRADGRGLGPPLGLPEAGALERPRAVHEDFLDLDHERSARVLAVHPQAVEQRLVTDDRRAAVDAQRVLAAGDEEEQP